MNPVEVELSEVDVELAEVDQLELLAISLGVWGTSNNPLMLMKYQYRVWREMNGSSRYTVTLMNLARETMTETNIQITKISPYIPKYQ